MNKKIFLTATLLIIAFLSSLIAQNVPTDQSIRIGTLENGMRYYIKKNQKPEKKVELRLAVNAGSILEDEDQLGLAHFMEHMNFNGTTNFPDNKLVDFLQSIGIKFGQHLNAYTSFDETVYMLPVPLDKAENLVSGLKVIEDWAFNATLSGEQIDKERGVVLEELRLGLGPDKRMMDRYLPKVMYKSQYAKRLPIGDKKLIETFTYDKIRRFHKDWYRPNLMAIIVVGDIDVNDIEKRIKENFSKYKNPKNERERKVFELPIHKETLVAIESDPDATFARVQVLYKGLEIEKNTQTVESYNKGLLKGLYSLMMSNRIQELVNSNNPPFTFGSISYSGTWARGQKALQGFAITKPGEQIKATEVLINEIERAKRFGFTKNELERAKSELLARFEQNKNNKNKTESSQYVEEYTRNFLEKEVIPGIDWEYEQFKDYAPKISLEQMNQLAKELVTEQNRVVVITGPEKENIKQPTEEEVLALFNENNFTKLTAYEEKNLIKELIKKTPKKGKIKKTEKDEKLGTTTLTLSNGVKVTYKKTTFKDDEILFEAISLGGTTLLDDEKYKTTKFAFDGLEEAGFNGYTKSDIQKYLSGKQVRVSPFVSSLYEGMRGNSTKKDFKTMMEMIYSYFTGLNNDQASFDAFKQKQSSFLSNLLANPQYYFSNELSKFINQNNPRFTNIIPLEEDWDRTNYKEAYQIFKTKFADANNFHFYFVGSIDEAKIKEYAEQYLASLPTTKDARTFEVTKYRPIAGNHNKVIKKGKDPKSMVMIRMWGETKYNEKEDLALQAFGEVATIKVIEKLREEESGIYGGGARGGMNKTPYGHFSFSIQFPCGPEDAQKLTESALNELKKLIENGPEQKDLDKYKKGEINDLNTQLKTNKFWLNSLTNNQIEGGNKYDILKIEEKINELTVDDLKDVGKKYLAKDKIIATLMPEDGWEKETKKEESQTSSLTSKQLIDNYIKALGGREKLEKVKSLTMESLTKTMGMEIKGVTKKMYPNKFRQEQDMMGQKMIQVFDGENGYTEQAGNKMPFPPQAIENLKKNYIIEALAIDIEKVTEVQETEIDGKKCYVLVDEESGKAYFDKNTNLLYKSTSPQTEMTILEYTTVDGIKFVSKMNTKTQGQDILIEFLNIVINKGVSADDFK